MERSITKNLFCALLIAVFCVLLYYPVIGHGYVWDDTLLFLDNTGLVHEPLSWSLLAKPVLEGTSYLRPLVFLSWFAEFKVYGGARPEVSHAINVLLHSFNSVLVFFLALFFLKRKLSDSSLFASFAAALLYVCHPALVEATAWVSGRFDLLCTTFILLSCLAYVYLFEKKILSAVIVGVSFLLALFSKELGAVLPVLLVCLWFAFRGEEKAVFSVDGIKHFIGENKAVVMALGGVFFCYLLIRAGAPGGVYHISLSQKFFFSTVFIEQMPLLALRMYFWATVFPFSSVDPIHPISAQAVGGLGFLLNLAMLVATFCFFKFGRKLGNTQYWFVISWFICLLPVLHFIPLTLMDNVIHQRFMTAPLAFFSIAFGGWCGSFYSWARSDGRARHAIAVVSIGVYLFVCVLITRSVLPIWSSDAMLWGWAHKKYPESDTAFNNYVYGLIKEGAYDEALSVAQERKEKDGGLAVDSQILYAVLLTAKGDEEALPYIRGVVEVLPKFHDIYDKNDARPPFLLNSFQFASAYAAMASAQLVFNHDLEAAVQYNNIAQWYLDDSEKKAVWFQRLALEFLAGREEAVSDIIETIREWNFYSVTEEKKNAKSLVAVYCDKGGNECKDLAETFSAVIDRI